jgi:hypothetical protein
MKTCKKCATTYEEAENQFHKDKSTKDGLQGNCIACKKIMKHNWYKRNKKLTYERSTNWHLNNPEKSRESQKKSASRPEARLKKRERNDTYRKNNPHKIKAHDILKRAVRSGKVVKPKCCAVCLAPVQKEELQGHHEDYDRPLCVVWLCVRCHTNYHIGQSKEANEIRFNVRELYDKRQNSA